MFLCYISHIYEVYIMYSMLNSLYITVYINVIFIYEKMYINVCYIFPDI